MLSTSAVVISKTIGCMDSLVDRKGCTGGVRMCVEAKRLASLRRTTVYMRRWMADEALVARINAIDCRRHGAGATGRPADADAGVLLCPRPRFSARVGCVAPH